MDKLFKENPTVFSYLISNAPTLRFILINVCLNKDDMQWVKRLELRLKRVEEQMDRKDLEARRGFGQNTIFFEIFHGCFEQKSFHTSRHVQNVFR